MFAGDWNKLENVGCSGGATISGVEYHHASSVSAGARGNYIVASRELATIWSLAADGSGAQWTLSSKLPHLSDFAFEREGEAFYAPHAALQLANGDLLVVDDGAQRPGCYNGYVAGCFSRAVLRARAAVRRRR